MVDEALAPRRLISAGPEATVALGAALGARLEAGTRIALRGEMGTGKTTFVRGLARGLACADPVSSPSFTLMQSYAGRLPLYHFDAWMEGRQRAYLLDGGAECLAADGVSVVEWSERVEEFMEGPRIVLELSHLGPERRGIVLEARGAGSEALALLIFGLVMPQGLSEERPAE